MDLLAFFLFSALFAVVGTAGPTVCSCSGRGCGGSGTVDCTAEEDSCIGVKDVNELTADQSTSIGFYKSCAVAADHVNNSFRFDFGDEGSLSIASRLCNDTDCQPSFDYVYMEAFLNGKTCPKCYKPGYTSCKDNGTVSCRGNFITCAVISGEMSEGPTKIPFAAKGCARTDYDGDISEKAPVTIASEVYTYKFVKVTFRPANSALAAKRRFAFTLDYKDLGPRRAFFFP
ncbi:uncharacterized protein LOC110089617 [Pogona vitticeps]